MTENTQPEIKSPCIGVCAVDESSGLCQGCYRTIDEIKAWWGMGQTEQKNLLVALEERQLQQVNFDD
ncbi:DUF1289 domain-containing protein [Methylotenera sp.]|uniref:DUF1289 domain-containing protein n=1 Tax=Methylotenera sp. TaxID=2051956 RepID=UPI00271608F3|nr:DUF1289 domain-containing protein [Methylotenera sp.]MDO9392860.1 DUF1289 domain-containing protein [Methylotenera sp.]MDP1521777.1 DUF1289 domain-containing protein [Methylotenera sp.]MDP2070763.1 DUF1289 domain-containing protein [Methylotenera sp.]MDP3004756.1 DUF1289 domain-containing protein [Methylotenera sp.]MDZ4210153.1 DUF1289 domain-containing protein [Methylotenera sp.]